MLYYGIELAAGTNVTNLVCEGGATLPSTNLNAGRLFYNTTNSSLYLYTGAAWIIAAGSTGGVSTFNTRTGAVTLVASDLVGLIDPTNLPVASASMLGGVKIGSGITVGIDGTISSAAGSGTTIPAGSRLLWSQTAAPTGWTQVTDDSANNRMLRVVNTVGGTTGSGGTGGGGYDGTDNPTLMDKVPSHTHAYSSTTSISGDHTHNFLNSAQYSTDDTPANNPVNHLVGDPGAATLQLGSAIQSVTYLTTTGNHTHSVSGSTNINGSAVNWIPRYHNLILCSKD